MALLLSTFVIYLGHARWQHQRGQGPGRSMNLRGWGSTAQSGPDALSRRRLHLGPWCPGYILTAFLAYPLIDWPLGLRLGEISLGRWLRETYLPGVVPACAGALACLGARMYVHPATIGTVGSCAAFGVVVYVAVLGIWCLQPADREDLARVMRRIDGLSRWGRDLLARCVLQHR
jgi:hypothetical protein